jgi:hypothetical protein
MSPVRARPSPEVTVSLSDDGHLMLHSAATGSWHQCGPVGAAMWIALQQNDGDCAAAADMLAEVWAIDPVNMRADLELWVAELCDAGLLTCT